MLLVQQPLSSDVFNATPHPPAPAARPGRRWGLRHWHPSWRTWTRHRWRAPCPAAPCHGAGPHHPPAPAAPQQGDSTPIKAPQKRMTSIMGSRRGRMLCSRTTTAFLSLKTDFLEGTDAWHGLSSWRGRKCHSLEEMGLGCPPEEQYLQCGGAHRSLVPTWPLGRMPPFRA